MDWRKFFGKNKKPSTTVQNLTNDTDSWGRSTPLTSCTWLNLLSWEISSIETVVEPRGKKRKDDNSVGRMTEEHMRLYTLWRNVEESAEQSILRAKYAHDEEVESKERTKGIELQAKASVLREIFWISVKDNFGLWDKPSIGIREGFEVVWSDRASPQGFVDFLLGDPHP